MYGWPQAINLVLFPGGIYANIVLQCCPEVAAAVRGLRWEDSRLATCKGCVIHLHVLSGRPLGILKAA